MVTWAGADLSQRWALRVYVLVQEILYHISPRPFCVALQKRAPSRTPRCSLRILLLDRSVFCEFWVLRHLYHLTQNYSEAVIMG